MIGFKGRWWCGEQRTCAKAGKCDRVFRARHRREAKKWWGLDDYPVIWQMEPKCFVPVEEDT